MPCRHMFFPTLPTSHQQPVCKYFPFTTSTESCAVPRSITSRVLASMNEQAGAKPPVDVHNIQQQTFLLRSLCQFLIAAATAPYRRAFNLYTWKPIREIRAANGHHQLLILLRDFKQDKYAELQSVQVAVRPLVTSFSTLNVSGIHMADLGRLLSVEVPSSQAFPCHGPRTQSGSPRHCGLVLSSAPSAPSSQAFRQSHC
jgi:hypothetical protein